MGAPQAPSAAQGRFLGEATPPVFAAEDLIAVVGSGPNAETPGPKAGDLLAATGAGGVRILGLDLDFDLADTAQVLELELNLADAVEAAKTTPQVRLPVDLAAWGMVGTVLPITRLKASSERFEPEISLIPVAKRHEAQVRSLTGKPWRRFIRPVALT
jgi:hypothetical protein